MRFPVILLLAGLAGCTTWRSTDLSPRAVLEQPRAPGRIEVVTDSGRFTVIQPSLAGDSLRGFITVDVHRTAANPAGHTPATFALADITGVRLRKVSAVRTVLMVGSLGLFAAAAVAQPEFSGGGRRFVIRIPCGLFGEPCR